MIKIATNLINKKIKQSNFIGKDVKSLSDHPSADGVSAAQLKAMFDKSSEEVITNAVNTLIDILSSTEGACNIGKSVSGNVQDHINDVLNPHSTTKTQLGLGNVDNTKDTDKPISTATQTRITALEHNVLTKDNTTAFEPTADYHPVTLKKLNEAQFVSGSVTSIFGKGGDITALDCGEW